MILFSYFPFYMILNLEDDRKRSLKSKVGNYLLLAKSSDAHFGAPPTLIIEEKARKHFLIFSDLAKRFLYIFFNEEEN